MTIPILETSRLILRELRASDFDDYARICADAETMRYISTGKPLSRQEAWRSLAFLMGHWQLRGFGLWAVVNKATSSFIGRIGFYQPEAWPGFEIGWLIAREHWGQGFATEGAHAALQLAVPNYGHKQVISLIQPDNTASIRVAEKIGETLTGETEIQGKIALIYSINLKE